MSLTQTDAHHPVGVFDSGLGGLTVLSAIHRRLPGENLIYFGDTARVPYGSKSKETVIRYSLEILEFLLTKNVKYVVAACNTASSLALQELRERSPVPVLGVVEPGVLALARYDDTIDRAGVIATRSTIRSGAYEKTASRLLPSLSLFSKACPLLVPMIEEGFLRKNITELILREYLDEIEREGIRHLILGCTHYPLLKETITRLYPQFNLIDSSEETAVQLEQDLTEKKLTGEKNNGRVNLFVSDITDSFRDMEKLFFGSALHSVEKVVLGW
ncbi:MAG: glutamate racemase [Leptospiraceae bacterium]|nr:glutamate racemase [Leptospiraceae bacterium]